jgi:prevent-host-death family protein
MAQYKIGVRELKAHLSSYLEKAQMGHTIVITSRGKPIADLTPSKEEVSERIKTLQTAGLILWNGKKPSVRKPKAKNTGKKLISDIVVEMRE